MLEVYDLKTEYRREPMGIDAAAPRLSWKLYSDRENVMQEAYRICACRDGTEIWDSSRIASPDSQAVPYGGPALQSGDRITWTVTVEAGGECACSGEASFEMGLLREEDWVAEWIQPEEVCDYDACKPAPLLRREFQVRSGLVRARIYQTAHGLYSFRINGARGSSARFTPGLTSYHHRLQYQCCDITPLLHQGANCWAVQLADGWWRGSTGGGYHNNFGFYLSYLGQIRLDYDDGSREIIGTDRTFRTSDGGLKRSDMKAGDLYDAKAEPAGWQLPGFDDSGWRPVFPAREFTGRSCLIASRSVPVTEHERLTGQVMLDADGNTVLDFGQNLAGYVDMLLRDTVPGQTVTLWHGEGLKDGRFSTENLAETVKEPLQEVTYFCRGGSEEHYCPEFPVFGFRYVKLAGYPADRIRPGDFTAVAVYSDLEEVGSFTCSNPLINQLVSNSRWSQKSNFLDVPTDCPTRERSPWAGDGQVYCKTAADFMNVYPFYEKWLSDLNMEQFTDGCVPNTFPATNALHNREELDRMIAQKRYVFAPPTMAGPGADSDLMEGAAGWGDTATITPWTMYLCYGDLSILRQQYPSARRWVEFCRSNARNRNPLYADMPWYSGGTEEEPDGDYIYDTHFHWGEWLEPDAVENGGPTAFDPMEFRRRGNPLVATAYLYYSSRLLAKMARLLGYDEDARTYHRYADRVRRVYNRCFIAEDGTILAGRQAPYARTLAFDLAENPDTRKKLSGKLAEAVEQAGFTINTGFLSTPFLLRVLVDAGYPDHAFRLLEQTAFPGWLHPITLGATTIPENWGGFDDYSGSFNHYSYGAVCDFLFSTVAGIRLDEESPGYRHFFLQPVVGGSLTHAEAAFESPYGMIRSAWRCNADGSRTYTFEIPAGTCATLILPDRREELGSGRYVREVPDKA